MFLPVFLGARSAFLCWPGFDKKVKICSFCLIFHNFCIKRAKRHEKEDFDECLECAAPKTLVKIYNKGRNQLRMFFQAEAIRNAKDWTRLYAVGNWGWAYRKQEVDIKTKKKSKNHCHMKNTLSTKKTYFSKNLRKHAIKFWSYLRRVNSG